MTDLLSVLGGLTLSGSAVVCVLALLSRSSRSRYGAKWRCWVWLLLCLRLAVPLSLFPLGHMGRSQPLVQLPAPSDTVIYQYQPGPSHQIPGAQGQQPSGSHAAPPPSTQDPKPPIQTQPDEAGGFTLSLSQLLVYAWLAGAGAFLLWSLASHLRFLAYLRRWAGPVSDGQAVTAYNQLGDKLNLDRRPRLMVCPGLRAPMLAGLFRPVLLLPPEGPSGNALEYSLLHELTHFRRRDIWLKALALWVNAVHWFNPLMWYMVRLVEQDTELACDEDALSVLPRAEHAAYGRTILAAAARVKEA